MRKFVKQFTDKEIKYVKVENKYYQITEEPPKEKWALAGIYLGEKVDDEFIPSIELLNIISRTSKKKVYVSKKGEWQFLNNKDILGKSVLKADVKNVGMLVLVQNERGENLGYGKIVQVIEKNEHICIKNILDRGEYLRKERYEKPQEEKF